MQSSRRVTPSPTKRMSKICNGLISHTSPLHLAERGRTRFRCVRAESNGYYYLQPACRQLSCKHSHAHATDFEQEADLTRCRLLIRNNHHITISSLVSIDSTYPTFALRSTTSTTKKTRCIRAIFETSHPRWMASKTPSQAGTSV